MRQVAENCRRKTYLFTHFLQITIFYWMNSFTKDHSIDLCKQNFIKAVYERPLGRWWDFQSNHMIEQSMGYGLLYVAALCASPRLHTTTPCCQPHGDFYCILYFILINKRDTGKDEDMAKRSKWYSTGHRPKTHARLFPHRGKFTTV
jgi:hypothetical protein